MAGKLETRQLKEMRLPVKFTKYAALWNHICMSAKFKNNRKYRYVWPIERNVQVILQNISLIASFSIWNNQKVY